MIIVWGTNGRVSDLSFTVYSVLNVKQFITHILYSRSQAGLWGFHCAWILYVFPQWRVSILSLSHPHTECTRDGQDWSWLSIYSYLEFCSLKKKIKRCHIMIWFAKIFRFTLHHRLCQNLLFIIQIYTYTHHTDKIKALVYSIIYSILPSVYKHHTGDYVP